MSEEKKVEESTPEAEEVPMDEAEASDEKADEEAPTEGEVEPKPE